MSTPNLPTIFYTRVPLLHSLYYVTNEPRLNTGNNKLEIRSRKSNYFIAVRVATGKKKAHMARALVTNLSMQPTKALPSKVSRETFVLKQWFLILPLAKINWFYVFDC